MAQTTVRFNLQAFEHFRIDRRLKIKDLSERLGRHPGSISNWLLKARRGEKLGISQIAALAWSLSVRAEDLMIFDPTEPEDAQPE